MLLLNFAHPLTAEHLRKIEGMAGEPFSQVLEVMPDFDRASSLEDQIRSLLNDIALSSIDWHTMPLIVNLPGFAPAAAALIAQLHGRSGHFPTILHLREVEGSTPTRYEVAELINLQEVRERARARRHA